MDSARLTRQVSFAAAHRYYRSDWSEQRNRDTFGACANPIGHGHTYTLAATVEAAIDEQTGFSANLAELDSVLEREVIARFDHQHINHAIAEFGDGGMIPTSENILRYLWPRIADGLSNGARLHRLRLYEDSSLYVDYHGK